MTSLLPDRSPKRAASAGQASPRVVVIGGGIAGLASAALLASRGYDVDLIEKNDELGGRVGSIERDGFRFDTGASWYLMPEVFEHFFSLLGTTVEAQLDLAVLDPSYRVFFEGHPEPVDVRPDRAHNRALFESLEPGAGARFDAYLRLPPRRPTTSRCAAVLYSNFNSPSSFLHPDIVRRTPALSRLLTRSLGAHVAARFSDNRLRQVLGYPAVFLGSSPSRAPSLYHLMSRLDLGDRVLYPQGGFTRLIEVIAALAQQHGARVHTGRAATRIMTAASPGGGRDVVVGVGTRRATASSETSCPPMSWWVQQTCTTSRRRSCPGRSRRTPNGRGSGVPPVRAQCWRCWASRGASPGWPTTRCSSPATGTRTSATSSDVMLESPTPLPSTCASPRRRTRPWHPPVARTSSS